ncbi:MAG: ferric reductase-like transmembrane domain-containing protein [Thalassobaculaceae bacterium]
MSNGPAGTGRTALIWLAVAAAVAVPIAAAANSPLLAWRQPVYIAAGFAGIAAMAFLFLQPLLIGGYLPGLRGRRGRHAHRLLGALLIGAIALHVIGLWITSPPDVVDALLFRSPTPFSDWGVIALWASVLVALVAAFRGRLKLKPRTWRLAHMALAALTVICTAIHALLIEGTMETASKIALSALAVAATVKLGIDLKVWATLKRSRVADR